MPGNNIDFFKQITAPLVEGVIIIDRSGVIQAVNQAVTNLFGYAQEELIGQNVKILMPTKYSDHHDDYIENYKKTGEAKILDVGRDVEGQTKSGAQFSLNLKVNEVFYEDKPYYMGVILDIQKQKDADDTIHLQTELLERAEEVAHLGHWRMNLIENSLYWSKEIYRIHGVTPENYTPELESAINFYHPDDLPMIRESVEKAISDHKEFTFEARLVRPNGEIRHVRSSGEVMARPSGEAEFVFGVFQDISDQVKAYKALEDQNSFLSTLMETNPDLLFVKNDRFEIVDANKAFLSLYPEDIRDSVIGRTTIEEYDEEDASAFLENDKIAFDRGFSEVEESVTFPDGVERTLLTKKVRFFQKDSQPFILGIGRDITELKQAHKNLLESENTREAYANASDDGYWDWYLQDDYEFMSPRFWTMLGYDPSEKKHHPSEWQCLIFEEDLKLALENFDRHVETRGEFPFDQEVRYRHKNGSTVYVICKGRVVEWAEDGSPLRMIGTHTDITKLKETEEALVFANAELEEFAYRTSHDLRSPLISSIALINMIRTFMDGGDVERSIESLDHVERSLKKLEQLVQDILSLSRAQNAEEASEDIDVKAVFDEALEKFAHLESFDRINLSYDQLYEGVISVKPFRFKLIVENLISNAVKYQDLDEKRPFIQVTSYKQDGAFVFDVEDNGLGIPENSRENLFRMFKRFHTNVSFGSGLGLYMIKKSAEILGGDIFYIPKEKGSCFRLKIPL